MSVSRKSAKKKFRISRMFARRLPKFAVKILGDTSALQTAIDKSGERRVVAWFTASWCGPCKSVTPFVEKLSESTKNVDFIKIDIDSNEELAEKYEVTSVPTFVMFKDRALVGRILGASSTKIEELVKANA